MSNKKKKVIEQNQTIKDNRVRQKRKSTKGKKVVVQETTTQNKNIEEQKSIPKRKRVLTKEEIIRKKKKIKNTIRFIILLIIMLGIGAFLCTSKVFKIQEIKIFGNEQIMKEELQVEDKIGHNIFLISKIKIEKDFKKNPYVKKVTTKKVLPNKL